MTKAVENKRVQRAPNTTKEDIATLTWEQNVPIPPKGVQVFWDAFLKKANDGDSVFLNKRSMITSLLNSAKRVGASMIRRTEDNGTRFWLYKNSSDVISASNT